MNDGPGKHSSPVDAAIDWWGQYAVIATVVSYAITVILLTLTSQTGSRVLAVCGVVIAIPSNLLLVSLFFLPNYRRSLPHDRRRARRCPNCGYDVRATPDRCPECGNVLAKE
jgi:hypothetical protein